MNKKIELIGEIFLNKRKWLTIGAIFLLSFILISWGTYMLLRQKPLCGDGSFYDNCSSIKPYFCLNGTLVEKASVCGCSSDSMARGEKCISEYQTGPKTIFLSYILKGEKRGFNFTIYDGLYQYISNISRIVDSRENPTLLDFKLKLLNEKQQRELLLPLVADIENSANSKEDQARIAISLVQSIPFGNSDKTIKLGRLNVEYQRYPYEVLYDMEATCSEKSALLIFLLREIGYKTAFIYYVPENHEVVGIGCLGKRTVANSSYCFIETTGTSIISDDKNEYTGETRLYSNPQIINISDGISFGKDAYEYKDVLNLIRIRESMNKYGTISFFQHLKFQKIKEKYGLTDFNELVF